jgi:HD-like signal output (HDOD) protein
VTLLGPRRTIVLILSQCAAATSTALVSDWQEPLRQWFYRRSVLTAGIAQSFAAIEGVSPETAFLFGLVQDIGIAVTANAAGERYARLIERAQGVPHLTLPDVERPDFGHTHAEVSAALLQKWEMPTSLIDPVLAHHGGHVQLPKVGLSFVRLMQIGEAVADLADCRCPQRNNRLNDLLSHYDGRQKSQCSQAMADGVARAVEAAELLRLPIPNPESISLLAQELQAVEDGNLVGIL